MATVTLLLLFVLVLGAGTDAIVSDDASLKRTYTWTTPGNRRDLQQGPSTTPRTWLTGETPRLQWTANNGYCGELSLITAGMRFGQYYSQFDVRAAVAATQKGPNGCVGTQCQPDPTATAPQQQQLLVGVNDMSTATALNLAARWYSGTGDSRPGGNRHVEDFLTWVKAQVRKGYSVSFGVYDATFWQVPNTPAGQLTYDHIVSVYSVSSNYDDTDYHDTDVLTFSDHGLYSGGVPGQAGYSAQSVKVSASTTVPLWSFRFGDPIVQTRVGCNSQNVYPYCVPAPGNVTSGGNWAIAYLGSMDNQTYPVSLSTTVNNEGGMDGTRDSNVCPGGKAPDYTCCNGCMPEGSYERPPSSAVQQPLTVTIRGLTAGVQYNLYRFNSWQMLPPTNPPTPMDFSLTSKAVQKTLFVPTGATYSTTYVATLGEQVIFRAGLANLPPPKKVVVVGAGISGLAAANTLTNAGFNVTIVEARNRIGGRMWTDRNTLSIPADLGAGWIHEGVGNPITDLANAYSVRYTTVNKNNNQLYDVNGAPISSAAPEALYSSILSTVLASRSTLSSDMSIQTAINLATGALNPALTPTQQLYLNEQVNTMLEHEYAADVSDLSLLYYDEGIQFTGPDYLMIGGFDGIASGLAVGQTILLNQVVSRIAYNATQAVVTTSSGRQFAADYVVVTLPLGVLQAGSVAFSPALSTAKAVSLTHVGMGVLDKVWLQFPYAFWLSSVETINCVTTTKGYFTETYNIQFYTGVPVLLMFNAAAYGTVAEGLTDGQILTNAMGVLRLLYGATVPSYSQYIITRWKNDPYSRGSYSYSRVGAVQPDDRNNLAANEGGRLFFAGEHTSAQYPATVHGAYLSGLAAGAAIANLPPAPTPAPTQSPKPVVVPTVTVYATQTIAGTTILQASNPRFLGVFVNATAAAIGENSGAVAVVDVTEASSRRFVLALRGANVRFTVTSRQQTASALAAGLLATGTLLALNRALGAIAPGATVSPPVIGTSFLAATPTPGPTQYVASNLRFLSLLVLIIVPCCCGCFVCCYWNWLCENPRESGGFRFPPPTWRQAGSAPAAEDVDGVYDYGGGEFVRRTGSLLFGHDEGTTKPSLPVRQSTKEGRVGRPPPLPQFPGDETKI
jgi:hypothetical protein